MKYTNTKHKDKHKCSWHKSESKGAHPHEAIKVVAQPALEISLWNHHGTVAGPLAPIVKWICLYFKIILAKVQSVFDQSCICPNFQINLLKKIIVKPLSLQRSLGNPAPASLSGDSARSGAHLFLYFFYTSSLTYFYLYTSIHQCAWLYWIIAYLTVQISANTFTLTYIYIPVTSCALCSQITHLYHCKANVRPMLGCKSRVNLALTFWGSNGLWWHLWEGRHESKAMVT